MGSLERRRPRTMKVTALAVVILVYSALATIIFAYQSAYFTFVEEPPNPTLQAWLQDPEIRPGLFVTFLMEHPRFTGLVQLAVFITLTVAAYGTIQRRNRDRELLCLGLLAYVAMRGMNVYLALFTNMKPVTSGDRADFIEAIVNLVFCLAAIAFFSWRGIRAEFDDSRIVPIEIRRLGSAVGGAARDAVHPRAATSASRQPADPREPSPRTAVSVVTVLQILLIFIFLLLTLLAVTKGAAAIMPIAVAYAAIFGLTLSRDDWKAAVLSILIGVAVFTFFIPVAGRPAMLPGESAAPIALLTLNGLLIAVAIAVLLRRTTRRTAPAETAPDPGRNARLVTAVGRAVLVYGALTMVSSAQSAISQLGALLVHEYRAPIFEMIRGNLLIVAWLAISAALVFGSIAFLERRPVAVNVLRLTTAALALREGYTLMWSIHFASGSWIRLFVSQFNAIAAVAGFIALLWFLSSNAVRQELDPNRQRVASPPVARDEPVTAAMRAAAVIYVLALIASYAGLMFYVSSYFLAFFASFWGYNGIGIATALLAGGVAVWTMKTRSRFPHRAGELVAIICIALVVVAILSPLQILTLSLPSAQPIQWGLLMSAVLWPLTLVTLLWIRQTRLLGLALVGAFGVSWLPRAFGGALAFPWIALTIESGQPIMFWQFASLLAWAIVAITGLVAAWRVFLTYPGRLSE